ncbi:MAG: hypothetical protein JWP08_3893, partial [Bryobacterales bacterium]|nr:hypothetical protein [Bryobacterales bacterium]
HNCRRRASRTKEIIVLRLVLIIILFLLLLGALPSWPYSTGWGYYPSGGLGLLLIVVLVLVLLDRRRL